MGIIIDILNLLLPLYLVIISIIGGIVFGCIFWCLMTKEAKRKARTTDPLDLLFIEDNDFLPRAKNKLK